VCRETAAMSCTDVWRREFCVLQLGVSGVVVSVTVATRDKRRRRAETGCFATFIKYTP